ncbi:MAG: hypothetical protein GY898_01875 [Proteobacteria bacterium]|nr:hypothetical protein [Pseudomonadota bacterium]
MNNIASASAALAGCPTVEPGPVRPAEIELESTAFPDFSVGSAIWLFARADEGAQQYLLFSSVDDLCGTLRAGLDEAQTLLDAYDTPYQDASLHYCGEDASGLEQIADLLDPVLGADTAQLGITWWSDTPGDVPPGDSEDFMVRMKQFSENPWDAWASAFGAQDDDCAYWEDGPADAFEYSRIDDATVALDITSLDFEYGWVAGTLAASDIDGEGTLNLTFGVPMCEIDLSSARLTLPHIDAW